jgi:YesN/AraC family two-component response regulator
MLSRLGISFIKTFLNGSAAIEYINSVEDFKTLPNLILTDLEMPFISGFELIKLIGECSAYKEPPIFVACTGTCPNP